jgi:hypothetical protein
MEFTLAKQKASTLSKLHSGVHSFPNAALLSRYGLIIISEFMSSARVMRGAVTINPWKTHEVIQFDESPLVIPCHYDSFYRSKKL